MAPSSPSTPAAGQPPVAPALTGIEAGAIIEGLDDGIAVVDDHNLILWGNAAFRQRFGESVAGRPVAELLHGPMSQTALVDLFEQARRGASPTLRYQCDHEQWLDLRVAPLPTPGPQRFILHLHDVTAEERKRQKLAALHHAGRALNNLDADALAEMAPAERIEVLKHNIRQFIQQLLNYNVIDIRLLDRQTGRLVPLLSEGIMPEAAALDLYARPEGNGVTGYVAATGRSYLCSDAACDSRFIEGAAGAKSSMTVPLLFGDEVIGTFNVESPRADAFTEQDLQFAETFSREIAQAIHTLELLRAEKSSTASASVEAVAREVALPADEILNTTTRLLHNASASDPESIELLRRIIENVRTIKTTIRKVGSSLAEPSVVNPRDAVIAEKLNGKRVLVADADERIRRSAHALLGKYGCQVETARTGREAVDLAGSGQYDAFLLDIRLPDGSAYDFYRKLRELQPNAVPVMMTCFGYDSAHSIVKARQDGLRAVLFKPFRPDQILDVLLNPCPAPKPVAAS
ncbi:MAG: response regulator [Gemmataceae bacterium]|nr:response regulator [Gemmataceae bacterium]